VYIKKCSFGNLGLRLLFDGLLEHRLKTFISFKQAITMQRTMQKQARNSNR